MTGLVPTGLFAILAVMFGSPADSKPPNRSEILKQAIACGFKPESLNFSVDSEGVDNVDVYPVGERDEEFLARAECLAGWAATTGAAVGLHFKPRSSQ